MEQILEVIKRTGVVAILRGISQEQLLPAVEQLIIAGIRAVEITFNTPGAAEMIRRVRESFGDDAFVGAGTVTTPQQADEAVAAGAAFILAPNFDPTIVERVKGYGKCMVPGAMTPTEIAAAYRAGGDIIKVFPAGTLGPQYIKDILGPYDQMPLMAVGGVRLDNAASFIKAGAMAVGLGGSLVSHEVLETKIYHHLRELARQYLEEVQRGRA